MIFANTNIRPHNQIHHPYPNTPILYKLHDPLISTNFLNSIDLSQIQINDDFQQLTKASKKIIKNSINPIWFQRQTLQNKTKIINILQIDLSHKQSNLNSKNQIIHKLQTQIKKLQNHIDNKKEQVKKVKSRCSSLKKQKEEKREQVKKYRNSLSKLSQNQRRNLQVKNISSNKQQQIKEGIWENSTKNTSQKIDQLSKIQNQNREILNSLLQQSKLMQQRLKNEIQLSKKDSGQRDGQVNKNIKLSASQSYSIKSLTKDIQQIKTKIVEIQNDVVKVPEVQKILLKHFEPFISKIQQSQNDWRGATINDNQSPVRRQLQHRESYLGKQNKETPKIAFKKQRSFRAMSLMKDKQCEDQNISLTKSFEYIRKQDFQNPPQSPFLKHRNVNNNKRQIIPNQEFNLSDNLIRVTNENEKDINLQFGSYQRVEEINLDSTHYHNPKRQLEKQYDNFLRKPDQKDPQNLNLNLNIKDYDMQKIVQNVQAQNSDYEKIKYLESTFDGTQEKLIAQKMIIDSQFGQVQESQFNKTPITRRKFSSLKISTPNIVSKIRKIREGYLHSTGGNLDSQFIHDVDSQISEAQKIIKIQSAKIKILQLLKYKKLDEAEYISRLQGDHGLSEIDLELIDSVYGYCSDSKVQGSGSVFRTGIEDSIGEFLIPKVCQLDVISHNGSPDVKQR